jgi:AcrR family transcriptional regulator
MVNSKTGELAPAPRKRDAERTKASILAAALKEFSQQGYSGARIDKIAKRAKANMRMIYHYYGNKQELYQAVLESAYDHILELEAQVRIDMDNPLESILALFGFVFEYFEEHPAFESLLRTENMMQGKFVLRSKHVTESSFPLRKVITELIENGTRQKVLRSNLDPVQVYVTILALSRFHLANAYSLTALLGTDLTQSSWRRERFEHAKDLLTVYLSAPAGERDRLPARSVEAEEGGKRPANAPLKPERAPKPAALPRVKRP